MDFFVNPLFYAYLGTSKQERTMFWTSDVLIPQRRTHPDASGPLLRAAVRTFRRAEVEAAKDPSCEGKAMAEFAELVVLPGLGER